MLGLFSYPLFSPTQKWREVMPAGTGAKLRAQPTSVTVKEQTFKASLKDFACEACGQSKVCLTERESWYVCVNCGYSFGIEPHPKKRLRRATDFVGSGWILH